MHYSSHNDLIRGLKAPGERLERKETAPYYKLIDAQGAAVPMCLPHTGNDGKKHHRHHMLYPKEKYGS